MGNKEDWEEIERYMQNLEQQKKDKYRGIDIENKLEKMSNKKESNIRKGFWILQVFTKNIVKIIIAIVVAIAIIVIFGYAKEMRHRYDIDMVDTLESMQHIKINVISKNLDEKENTGEYYFELKKFPNIKFKGIKNFGNEKNDFEDNLQKYLFENWNSDEKNNLQFNESMNNDGLLEYEIYYEFKTQEEMKDGIEAIINFLEYAEEWNKKNGKVIDIWQQKQGQFVIPSTKIYLKQKNTGVRIYPYNSLFQTADEIRESAEKEFSNLIK